MPKQPGTNWIANVKYPIVMRPGQIQILFREKIKVFYNSTEAASADGYNEYDRRFDVTRGGIVYPFTGLRGDAKELFR